MYQCIGAICSAVDTYIHTIVSIISGETSVGIRMYVLRTPAYYIGT